MHSTRAISLRILRRDVLLTSKLVLPILALYSHWRMVNLCPLAHLVFFVYSILLVQLFKIFLSLFISSLGLLIQWLPKGYLFHFCCLGLYKRFPCFIKNHFLFMISLLMVFLKSFHAFTGSPWNFVVLIDSNIILQNNCLLFPIISLQDLGVFILGYFTNCFVC